MEKVNYKVGDIVELVDGVQYVYRGKKGTMCTIRYYRTGYQSFSRSLKKSV